MKKTTLFLVGSMVVIIITIVLIKLNPGRKDGQLQFEPVVTTNVAAPAQPTPVQQPVAAQQTNSNEVKVRVSGLSFAGGVVQSNKR